MIRSKPAGTFHDLADSGDGGTDIWLGADDPGFLGMANRPDMNLAGKGPTCLNGRFSIESAKFIWESFPPNHDIGPFKLDPLYFGNLIKILQAFLQNFFSGVGKTYIRKSRDEDTGGKKN